MALMKTCFLLAITCGPLCAAIQLKRNTTSSESDSEFQVLKFYSAVPLSSKKTSTDRAKMAVPLRLAQWNVAGLCPEKCKEATPECAGASLALTKTLEQKLLAVEKYFDGHLPDVITLNEDIEFNATSSAHSLNLGSDYVLAGSCQAEDLWSSQPAYVNGGRFMQNSVWVRSSAWQIAKYETGVISSDSNKVPRCTVVATLTSGSKKVTVASVHLTGGRYVDERWATFAGNKAYEIRQMLNFSHRVMGQVPDVVIGDLNSYWNASDVSAHQHGYEPFMNATAHDTKEGYLSWAMEGVKALNESGYERLPIDQNTTKFGGVVDHIFVKMRSGVKTGSPASLGVVDEKFKKSDHEIIYAEIEVS